MVGQEEHKSNKNNPILRAKDVIGLQIDALGMLTTPSDFEPIPEYDEKITQLRITDYPDLVRMDFSRCMFRVETEVGQVRDGIITTTLSLYLKVNFTTWNREQIFGMGL